MYDFDTVRPRIGMNSSKWDAALKAGCPPDIVPLTVADMEFQSPPVVREALAQVAAFGMWGYTYDGDDFKQAIRQWMNTRHGWDSKPEWMLHTSGVVHGLYTAVRALTNVGDGVLVQSPVYYPFYLAITDTGRKIVENPLECVDGIYQIDFDDLAEKLKTARMMIFCSPHNPVGRVWSPADVEKVARLCLAAGVPLLSDEIHCDLIMPGHTHFSAGRLEGELLNNSIVATAASKTFSLAGLFCATLSVPNPATKEKMAARLKEDGYLFNSTFGVAATRTAYNEGADWLDELIVYLHGNYQYLVEELARLVPEVKVFPMEGTYLAWMDFSALKMDGDVLKDFLQKEAKLYLNDGRVFGNGGSGFGRLNLACPRSVVEGAVHRLAAAVASKRK